MTSRSPAMSADGRFVAFPSSDTNLVPGAVTSGQLVFVHDRRTGAHALVSASAAGRPGDDRDLVGGYDERAKEDRATRGGAEDRVAGQSASA